MNWRRFFHRSRRDSEIARDLEFYLAAEIEDNIARGMTPETAQWAAHRKLGNTGSIREEVYRMNTVGFLETTWQDIRYALRALRSDLEGDQRFRSYGLGARRDREEPAP